LWLPSIEVLARESGASKASTDVNKIEPLINDIEHGN
jgi:hypothetical protein